MSDNRWIGGASQVAQEEHLTPGGTIEVGDKFIVSIQKEGSTTQSISVSATGTTVAQVCADIQAAAAASTLSYFLAFTWSDQTTYVKALQTSNTGQPYTFTVSTTESDDSPADAQTFARSTTTAAQHPNSYAASDNWSAGHVPAAGENVWLEDSDDDILYGLDQSATELANFFKSATFTGLIGDGTNYLIIDVADGALPQIDYQYGGTTTASASGRCMISWHTAAAIVQVWGSSSTSEETGRQPTRFLFNSSTAELHVAGAARVAVAGNVAGETSTLGKINENGSARVIVFPGVTLTEWNRSGGDSTLRAGLTTLRNSGGVLRAVDAGTKTSVTVDSGTFTHDSSGTISQLNPNGGTSYLNGRGTVTAIQFQGTAGEVDLSGSELDRTVGSVEWSGSGSLAVPENNPLAIVGQSFTVPVDVTMTLL